MRHIYRVLTVLAAFSLYLQPVYAQSSAEKERIVAAVLRDMLKPYKRRKGKAQPRPTTIRPLQLKGKAPSKTFYDVVFIEIHPTNSAIENRVGKRLSDLLIPVKASNEQVPVQTAGKKGFFIGIPVVQANKNVAYVETMTHFGFDDDFKAYKVVKRRGVWVVSSE